MCRKPGLHLRSVVHAVVGAPMAAFRTTLCNRPGYRTSLEAEAQIASLIELSLPRSRKALAGLVGVNHA